jgi:hypothetical protein
MLCLDFSIFCIVRYERKSQNPSMTRQISLLLRMVVISFGDMQLLKFGGLLNSYPPLSFLNPIEK